MKKKAQWDPNLGRVVSAEKPPEPKPIFAPKLTPAPEPILEPEPIKIQPEPEIVKIRPAPKRAATKKPTTKKAASPAPKKQ